MILCYQVNSLHLYYLCRFLILLLFFFFCFFFLVFIKNLTVLKKLFYNIKFICFFFFYIK
jgi:hypothetical protein